MIERLRPAWTEEELKVLYAEPHAHDRWEDHRIRVEKTIELARLVVDDSDTSGADLSCGDGAIIDALGFDKVYRGDFAPGYEYHGPLERTLGLIPKVDVFICCETLEHLDDPLAVLVAIREKTKKLILSTPICIHGDENPEHYWAWDTDGVKGMLEMAGFTTVKYSGTPFRHDWYEYQIWGCI